MPTTLVGKIVEVLRSLFAVVFQGSQWSSVFDRHFSPYRIEVGHSPGRTKSVSAAIPAEVRVAQSEEKGGGERNWPSPETKIHTETNKTECCCQNVKCSL